ncbi:MAG: RNA polymerase sigma factor, partial [Pseudomonadota bacterium]
MTAASKDPDQRILLKKVAAGDKEAMRLIYQTHHDPLFGYLRRKCGDDALAADIVHEAMLDVWRSAKSYSGKSSPKTWIFAIASNKLVDHFRRQSRVSVVDEVPDVADDAPDQDT